MYEVEFNLSEISQFRMDSPSLRLNSAGIIREQVARKDIVAVHNSCSRRSIHCDSNLRDSQKTVGRVEQPMKPEAGPVCEAMDGISMKAVGVEDAGASTGGDGKTGDADHCCDREKDDSSGDEDIAVSVIDRTREHVVFSSVRRLSDSQTQASSTANKTRIPLRLPMRVEESKSRIVNGPVAKNRFSLALPSSLRRDLESEEDEHMRANTMANARTLNEPGSASYKALVTTSSAYPMEDADFYEGDFVECRRGFSNDWELAVIIQISRNVVPRTLPSIVETFYCGICLENCPRFDEFQLTTCSFKHTYCLPCLRTYLYNQVTNGVVDHYCPGVGQCRAALTIEEIKFLLTEAAFAKFQRLTQVKKNPFYRECPRCNTGITASFCMAVDQGGVHPQANYTLPLTNEALTSDTEHAVAESSTTENAVAASAPLPQKITECSLDGNVVSTNEDDDDLAVSSVSAAITDPHIDTFIEANRDQGSSGEDVKLCAPYGIEFRLLHAESVATNSSDIMDSCADGSPRGLITPVSPGLCSEASEVDVQLVDGTPPAEGACTNRLSIHNNSIHFNIDSVDSFDDKDKVEDAFLKKRAAGGLTSPLLHSLLAYGPSVADVQETVAAAAATTTTTIEALTDPTVPAAPHTVSEGDIDVDSRIVELSDQTHRAVSSPELQCPNCNYVYCFYHSDAHPGMSCEDFARKQSRRVVEAMEASEALMMKTTKPCPTCHCHGEERTCQHCSTHWCWLCKQAMTNVTEHYMSGECAGAQFIDESRYLAGEHRFYNRRRAYAMVFDGVPQPQLRAALRTFRNDPNRNEMHRNVHVRGPLPELCMECTCHCCSDRHFRCRNPCACLCNMQRNPLVHASLLRISRCWASPAVVRVRDIVFELIAFLHICIVLTILLLCAVPYLAIFVGGSLAFGPLGFLFALCWLIVFQCEGISIVSFSTYSFMNSGLVCVAVVHGLVELLVGLPLNSLFVLAAHMIGTRQQVMRVRALFRDGPSMVAMLHRLFAFWSAR